MPSAWTERLLAQELQIDKGVFYNLVKEIASDVKNDLGFEGTAILALQAATEQLAVEAFREAGFQRLRRGDKDRKIDRRKCCAGDLEMAAAMMGNNSY